MSKFVMVVQSQARDGRDAEYNKWYDDVHFDEICSIPGVTSGRRFESTPIGIGQPGLRYLSIYEVEADDAGAVIAEMGKRMAEGKMSQSDALDTEAAVLWFYKQL
jgi:hypothetical protein